MRRDKLVTRETIHICWNSCISLLYVFVRFVNFCHYLQFIFSIWFPYHQIFPLFPLTWSYATPPILSITSLINQEEIDERNRPTLQKTEYFKDWMPSSPFHCFPNYIQFQIIPSLLHLVQSDPISSHPNIYVLLPWCPIIKRHVTMLQCHVLLDGNQYKYQATSWKDLQREQMKSLE